MKKSILFFAFFVSSPSLADEQAAFLQQGQAAIQEFSEVLKGSLLSAIESGGPIEAITVCNDVAPMIASNLSSQYGFDIARTSLKARNPANRPDPWEEAVLNQFEINKSQGAAIDSLVTSKVTNQGNQQEMRMMKAIPTGKLCLTCHGENIDPTIQTKLHELYPDDQAIGYKLGDIRGAFTIRKTI